MDLECSWCRPGVCLVCSWHVLGVVLVCAWFVPGVDLVVLMCSWRGTGVVLVWTWCGPCVDLVWSWCGPDVLLVWSFSPPHTPSCRRGGTPRLFLIPWCYEQQYPRDTCVVCLCQHTSISLGGGCCPAGPQTLRSTHPNFSDC